MIFGMSKLPMWTSKRSFEKEVENWEAQSKQASQTHPIKSLNKLPQMPGISPETAKGLRWKSFKWMIGKDEGWRCIKHFLKHPIKYAIGYLRSLFSKKRYRRDGDFFFFGLQNEREFIDLCQKEEALIVVGFSYCHKPLECPSGRFNPDCIADVNHSTCQQCFIGKMRHLLPPDKTIPLVIPTVHYIGEKIFETVHSYPERQVIFLITACEMTLEMFSDWGNMVGVKGIGVRLDGRICNTMKAFELSERGIKPGLTVVLEETQKKMLQLIASLYDRP